MTVPQLSPAPELTEAEEAMVERFEAAEEPPEIAVERLSEALRFIDRNGCETFTRGRCLDAMSGRTRDAQYGADRWCDPCIALAALAALRGDRGPLAGQHTTGEETDRG